MSGLPGSDRRITPMLALFVPALCASVLAAAGCQQDGPVGVGARPQAEVMQQRDTSLVPIADTYVRQGSPNQNQGAELILRLQSSGKNRALLRWDQLVLAQAATGGTLVAARLELTIADLADNWSAAGRTVDLHRLTHAWTELGATWNCAVDSVPGNSRADCTGASAWDMDHSASYPWVATPTTTALLRNGQTGVVTFDVTADVQAWLAGQQPNYGWILKKTVEGDPGKVDFGSRHSGAAPRLVVTVTQSAGWPELTTYPFLDTSRLAHPEGDTSLIYFRTDIALRFKTGVSDSAKAVFFARHAMTVLGVARGQFFVRMPDPGPSLQSFYGAIDSLRSEPEVLVAIAIEYKGMRARDFVRLPTDGTGQTRSEWIGNASTTWAMRAIRAPLAWGCETGDYGGTLVPVGVFEWKHEPTHPELARSSPQLREPDDRALDRYEPVPGERVATRRAHAVYTTGLLTAAGDNASGIAGVSWRTRLLAYAGYSPANRQLPLATGFYLLADRMATDGIRVLSLSADGEFADATRPSDRKEDIHSVGLFLQDLLDRLPSLLVVVAAGNERYRGNVADYWQDSSVAPLRAALLILREDPAYHDRILVVAGTRNGNQFWDSWPGNTNLGSNFFAGGAVDVAAPAEDVAVLGPWSGQTGAAVPVTVQTGTSLSAPLVAGVAAQLLAMDSTLTPAEVKSYILRGAREPRLSATTGQMVTPPAVQGAPETVYQLDAYGALALLSSERAGTPICGFPVSVTPDYSSVVLERPGGPVTLTVPGQWIGAVSVAQGGRLLSVFNADMETGAGRSVIVDWTGRVQAVVPDVLRRFLERDTLDQTWGSLGYLVYTLRPGSGGPAWDVRPLERLGYQSEVCDDGGFYALAFSPSGEWVAVTVKWCALDGSPVRLWMVPTDPAGSPRLVKAFPPDEGSDLHSTPWDVGWSHDSRRVIYFTQRQGRDNTLIVSSVGADGVPHDVMVPETYLWTHAFTPDDSAVVTLEEPGPFLLGPCAESRRDPVTWAVLAGPREVGSCLDNLWYRGFPNAPPVRAGVARGAPASSPSQLRGARRFGLDTPAVALERSVVRVGARFPRALRVQVN